jgi:predicted ribosome quality control (RQC) complex YloA/Tae2 family protein
MTALAAITACALCSPSVSAEICMFRDAEGNVTYTNVKAAAPDGAKRIRCFEPERKPAPAAATASPSGKTERPGSKFPSVDRDTQRERDAERRRIIEKELAAEEQSLEKARQQLEQQKSIRLGSESNYQRYLDRLQPYQEAVQTHERNVQALKRELNNLP